MALPNLMSAGNRFGGVLALARMVVDTDLRVPGFGVARTSRLKQRHDRTEFGRVVTRVLLGRMMLPPIPQGRIKGRLGGAELHMAITP